MTEETKPATTPPPPPQGEHIMQFLAIAHIEEPLQAVSKPFCALAQHLVDTLPRNPERTVALRKLLEAMNAAQRALRAKP